MKAGILIIYCQTNFLDEFFQNSIFEIHLKTANTVLRAHFKHTRLSGRFAPIFHVNCEHFLFEYIVKQEQRK